MILAQTMWQGHETIFLENIYRRTGNVKFGVNMARVTMVPLLDVVRPHNIRHPAEHSTDLSLECTTADHQPKGRVPPQRYSRGVHKVCR